MANNRIKNFETIANIVSKLPSYCSAAFAEMYVDNSGQYRLCCHAKPNPALKKYTSDSVLPFEYFLSKEMENIRDAMLEGKHIPDCEKCNLLEKYGKYSYRHKYIARDGFITDIQEKTINLKLRISGAYCNLACYMCNPVNSTTKKNELNKIFEIDNTLNVFTTGMGGAKGIKHAQWNDIVANILENIHLIKTIHMTGGETLQLPKYWEFLDLIPNEYAKELILTHDTNLTKITYNNRHVSDNAKRFKSFHLSISCDHILDKLSWIRYPIDVKEFENNLQEIVLDKNINKDINCTVSILNIDDLFEIRDYYKNKFNVNVKLECMVVSPKELSISNLPEKLKDVYKEKYKNDFEFVLAELNKPADPKLFDRGLKYCDKLSAHRQFDFRVLWKDWLEKVKDYS